MESNKNKQGRKCFIITPIGEGNSTIYRKAKGVIESVIKPILLEHGFDDIKPAYEINVSGMINTQIINRIINDDLVIANLTGNNPNVMYELCLRHVVAKPIIHICENGTQLPFDIKDNRTIFYENDMLGVDELKNGLQDFVKEVNYDKECLDNPVYSAYRMGKLLKSIDDTEGNDVSDILSKILDEVSRLTSGSYIRRVSPIQRRESDEESFEINSEMRVGLERLNKEGIPSSMRVHELATRLYTTSENLVKIASKMGLVLKSHMSAIERCDIIAIMDFIASIAY